jgi:hypothetical protein
VIFGFGFGSEEVFKYCRSQIGAKRFSVEMGGN